MNSIEQGFRPEDLKNLNNKERQKPIEVQPETSEVAAEQQETTELEPEKALTQEESIFNKFHGKAKKIANVMILMTALSAAPGFTQEAYAQEKGRQPVKQEQVQQKEEDKINEAKLTGSSTWARGITESARADLKKIKTAEDAEWLIRSHFNQLVSEYYLPTKGNLKEGPYGIKTREYSEDDTKLLLQSAKEMKQLLQDLNTKYGIEAYDKRQEQIDDMIKKLERQSSNSFQKQKEVLDRFEKMLQERR